MATQETIRHIIEKYRNIAVYGMSKDPGKTAYWVPQYLAKKGYDITPVNPTGEVILKRKSYPDLKSVPRMPWNLSRRPWRGKKNEVISPLSGSSRGSATRRPGGWPRRTKSYLSRTGVCIMSIG
jgi:hypothetical protein